MYRERLGRSEAVIAEVRLIGDGWKLAQQGLCSFPLALFHWCSPSNPLHRDIRKMAVAPWIIALIIDSFLVAIWMTSKHRRKNLIQNRSYAQITTIQDKITGVEEECRLACTLFSTTRYRFHGLVMLCGSFRSSMEWFMTPSPFCSGKTSPIPMSTRNACIEACGRTLNCEARFYVHPDLEIGRKYRLFVFFQAWWNQPRIGVRRVEDSQLPSVVLAGANSNKAYHITLERGLTKPVK